jgi:hypothetical protein
MELAKPKAVRTGLVAAAATVALLAGTAQAASAAFTVGCLAPFYRSCQVGYVPSAAGHWVHYSIAPCGYARIYDNDTHQQVGPSKAYGGGYIEGLYGYNYYIVVTSSLSVACFGELDI